MDRWTVYFYIEIINSKRVSKIFERKFELTEDCSQFTAYKLAVIEAERIIKRQFPDGVLGSITMI